MSTLGHLLPFGYAAFPESHERLKQIVRKHSNTLQIIDTRYRPYSRYLPQWNRDYLQAYWRDHYVWMGNLLGNVNYNNNGPIQLAHPVQGISLLVHRLMQGQDIVILCACKQYERCHRKVVAEMVKSQLPEVEIILYS